MAAYLESLPHANHSKTRRSVASLELAAREGDKDGELWGKNEIFTFRHWGATETAHWAYLFAGIDSSCAPLVRLRTASPALSLPCSWKFPIEMTENDEGKILAGWRKEQGAFT